jgi:hypothetical protein
MPSAAATASSGSAVLPIPGSPRTRSASLPPSRAVCSARCTRSCSASRPISTVVQP